MIPLFVLISDIHFSVSTLTLASKALRAALKKATELNVPLIIAGDTNDTKALLRAEVANELISILKYTLIPVYILRGNHDQISEKETAHSLEFLKPYVKIVETLSFIPNTNIHLMPYQSDPQNVEEYVKLIPKGSILIMHQGVKGAWMGDYIQDKTSVDPSIFEGITVFSGHYHRAHSIGSVTYIGNPYTLSFGEATDGPKGFMVVNSDGSYERIHLDFLRKHIVIDQKASHLYKVNVNPQDLVSVKIRGFESELLKITKEYIKTQVLNGHENFKLELIFTENLQVNEIKENLSPEFILDDIIDKTPETDEQKNILKQLWRSLL